MRVIWSNLSPRYTSLVSLFVSLAVTQTTCFPQRYFFEKRKVINLPSIFNRRNFAFILAFETSLMCRKCAVTKETFVVESCLLLSSLFLLNCCSGQFIISMGKRVRTKRKYFATNNSRHSSLDIFTQGFCSAPPALSFRNKFIFLTASFLRPCQHTSQADMRQQWNIKYRDLKTFYHPVTRLTEFKYFSRFFFSIKMKNYDPSAVGKFPEHKSSHDNRDRQIWRLCVPRTIRTALFSQAPWLQQFISFVSSLLFTYWMKRGWRAL